MTPKTDRDAAALKAFLESPLGRAAFNDAAAKVTARFPNMGKTSTKTTTPKTSEPVKK